MAFLSMAKELAPTQKCNEPRKQTILLEALNEAAARMQELQKLKMNPIMVRSGGRSNMKRRRRRRRRRRTLLQLRHRRSIAEPTVPGNWITV